MEGAARSGGGGNRPFGLTDPAEKETQNINGKMPDESFQLLAPKGPFLIFRKGLSRELLPRTPGPPPASQSSTKSSLQGPDCTSVVAQGSAN